MCQKFVHPHMLHIIYIQLRETACYIVDQDITPSHDTELIGHKALFIIVHNIRNPVHRYRGLPASGNSLYENVVERALPYDLVLFLLYRSDDIPEHGVPVLAQILYQKLIICRHIAVIKTLQASSLNIIRSFEIEVNAVFTPLSIPVTVRNAVRTLPDLIFVIHTGDRRAPVHDLHIDLIAQDTMLSNVDRLEQPLVQIAVIDPAKKRLVICRLVFVQLVQTVLLQAPGSHHLVIQLDIAALHCVKQLLCLLVTRFVLPLILLYVGSDQRPAFS